MLAPWIGKAGWIAAGWTMIHFLWIGLLLGMVLALERYLIRKAPPQLRYGYALMALVDTCGQG